MERFHVIGWVKVYCTWTIRKQSCIESLIVNKEEFKAKSRAKMNRIIL